MLLPTCLQGPSYDLHWILTARANLTQSLKMFSVYENPSGRLFFWRGKETRLTVNTFCTMAWVPCSLWLVSPHSLYEPSFHEQYACRLGKCSQTETGLKANFFLMKGDKSITSYALWWSLFQSAKIWGLVKKIYNFSEAPQGYILLNGQWQWE